MKNFLRQHLWARVIFTAVAIVGVPVWIPLLGAGWLAVVAYEMVCAWLEEK